MPTPNGIPASRSLDYRTVWRWHFYAGVFCIPFVLWLSVTGTIFLFHPQIQSWIDRPYAHLDTSRTPSTVYAQVQTALAAVPGSSLNAYQLPSNPDSAAQILVDKGTSESRVYVDPGTLQVLKIANEDMRLQKFVSRLHGELLLGKYGSWIVELAASWAVIMVLTGLFLWWPRSATGLGGVLYPRLRQGGRLFWKDIHSVTGIYVSCFALFLLFTGLPWAKSWGGYLKAARHLAAGHAVPQDWTTSSSDILAARAARANVAPMQGMPNMVDSEHANHGPHHASSTPLSPDAYRPIDRIVETVAPLNLAYPVLISPPNRPSGNWTAKSDTPNRPLRVDLVLDPHTGTILQRKDFHAKPWLDRVIGIGIAAHEGQLFGAVNQLLSLFTTVGLFTLSLSGLVMWTRRRPEGSLGAPTAVRRVPFSPALVTFLVVFGLYMPFLGASMLLVGITERFLLTKIPTTQRWLGLNPLRA